MTTLAWTIVEDQKEWSAHDKALDTDVVIEKVDTWFHVEFFYGDEQHELEVRHSSFEKAVEAAEKWLWDQSDDELLSHGTGSKRLNEVVAGEHGGV